MLLWRCGIEKAGVPDLLMVLAVLVYGRVLVRVGLLSHAIFGMILVIGLG